MATIETKPVADDSTTVKPAETVSLSVADVVGIGLAFLASLRLTVTLFALSIVLVLAGTLAQIDHDVWYIIHNYFRTFFARIPLQVFFPRALEIPGAFWFPGGWTLGAMLSVNLLAAHAVRFRVSGRGRKLWSGVTLIAMGIGLTYAVIQSGLDEMIESELSAQFCNGLWHALRAALGGGTLMLAYYLALSYQRATRGSAAWLWWLGAATAALLGALVLWLFTHPEARLDPSGLRILWQLIKGGVAGLVLLAGCYQVFGRRAGIVLLHSGIGLMMFSELLTGLHAEEGQMQIVEGQTANFAQDIRAAELALIDKSDPEQDRVVVVPYQLLKEALDDESLIESAELPVAVRVIDYLPNAVTRLRQPGEQAVATRGRGALRIAQPVDGSTGVAMEQKADIPATYVELLDKQNQTSLGVFLLSPGLQPVPFTLDAQPFELDFRFKRLYKPYSVKLLEFQHDRYVGSNTPKNFASVVQLVDPEQSVDRKFKTWMNNPLRYGGDTLYQSSFVDQVPPVTVLQVVTNHGWMIPYVGCMLVGIGMFFHFVRAIVSFAGKRMPGANSAVTLAAGGLLSDWRTPRVWVPALVVLIFASWVASRARPPKLAVTEMQIDRFGQLPVAYQGRVKPLDTLARNALSVVSNRGTLFVEPENPTGLRKLFGIPIKRPATEWLLDLISGTEASRHHRVIRIDNLDVLQTLGLETRDGYRYSLTEFFEHFNEFDKQIKLAREVPEQQRTLPQRKFMELGNQIGLLNTLKASFASAQVSTESKESLQQSLLALDREIQSLSQTAPRSVPPATPQGTWQFRLEAERDEMFAKASGKEVNEATIAWRAMLKAYSAGDVRAFNDQVAAYGELIQQRADAEALAEAETATLRKEAEKLRPARVRFEAFFNHFSPFTLAMSLYCVAFLLTAASWLGWTVVLNRSANWLLWFTFMLHTFALVARIYISGRPPVTNLYSSAVFIGWAAVLFALLFEKIYRIGIGNIMASVIGFPTLFIAHNLAGDGDTFSVLQAVLDTQFWLATHVVCITLGYSTTLLAGALGIVYIFAGHVTKVLSQEDRRQLLRMTYGTLCFATFFSFIGTVLGGLWADDSWGRFWGWDPKENGALIIVIWNALVLHARWGGIVARRGLAVLAIFGNVVTAWSWFGVNAMGVGLHAYGFRSGMAFWLLVFVSSQLAIMFLGCLPESMWQVSSEKPALKS